MAIRVALHHKTEYAYDRLITALPHVVRLRPAPHCRTPILSYSLKVQPEPHFLNWQQDPYNNFLARLVFPEATKTVSFEVDLIAEMTVINPFDFFIESSAEKFPFTYDTILTRELTPYFEKEELGPCLAKLVDEVRTESTRTVDYLVQINQAVKDAVGYVIRLEPGIQTSEETLVKKTGSCRDSAWLLVQLMRHLGLAARFVSGYLIQLTADVKSLDGPSGTEVDFTDLHAWTEVYIPGAGWVGLDPTSGLLAGEGHIPLACAADPISAAPITGSFEFTVDPEKPDDKVREDFRFEMSVTRVHEDPRVTKPYTPRQWQAIEALGHRVDEELTASDVRLTMGGEPTFVSIDNRDADEWNTAALGPHKRERAGVLFRRLRDRMAEGGLLHFGQGKWYPGESLPRWALGCYWRKDGAAIWEDPALVAEDGVQYPWTPEDAKAFAHTLARRLGVDPQLANPGFEDVWYYLWRERRLPVNVDPLDSKLDDKEERKRLSKIFTQGLDRVIGYALPIKRIYTPLGPKWISGHWFMRREHMFLVPGDSPMGFRLPLDSIPWQAPIDKDEEFEVDPMTRLAPLPPRATQYKHPAYHPDGIAGPWNVSPWASTPFAPPSYLSRNGDSQVGTGGASPLMQTPYSRSGESPLYDPSSNAPLVRDLLRDQQRDPQFRSLLSPPGLNESQPGLVRTALCVEVRDGKMYVFMPPQTILEDYLDLVAAVEATAAELDIPVMLEGYSPPGDPRIEHFKVTPDPGVIEVNVQPAHSWDEMVKLTNIVYEEAHLSRLCTEKFMLDGKHTGTGGGNHIVVGGNTPADSPLLRRPHLLRSLLAYWHNHPSLSYLFSGMFLGPTSQAPRVDEARNDSLYELELAFQQIPDDGYTPPWLVDRVFRHLLTDVTGNTHRSEFCIDKLYSPDSSDGRRGLLEFRAFEMPPHAQMSLTQQLLMRAIIARFWDRPYKAKLARWGTELHDRFLLPHFVQQDFQDVLFEMRELGYPMQEAWFAPHFEFRFPVFGTIQQRGVQVELRQAIECWHVLGEESTGGGTARYVDSSLERIQIKVDGMTDTRHVVTCNGRRVPLHPTGVNGQYVAGVRYRAWQPPSCLHPTIGVNAPLVIDVIDSWMNRSLGGCSYHVAHPGGRSHEAFPVNSFEAEGRRHARFFAMNHTPGSIYIPAEETQPECPLTLDLRQAIIPPAPVPPGLSDGQVRAGSNGRVGKPHTTSTFTAEHSAW